MRCGVWVRLDESTTRERKKTKRTFSLIQEFSWESGSSSQLCISLIYHQKLDENFKNLSQKNSGEWGITDEQVGERVFIREISESMFLLSLHRFSSVISVQSFKTLVKHWFI